MIYLEDCHTEIQQHGDALRPYLYPDCESVHHREMVDQSSVIRTTKHTLVSSADDHVDDCFRVGMPVKACAFKIARRAE